MGVVGSRGVGSRGQDVVEVKGVGDGRWWGRVVGVKGVGGGGGQG